MHSISYCLIFCSVIGLGLTEETIECNKKCEQHMDQLIMELSTFGDPNGKYPVNQIELISDCKNDKKSVQWIRTYIDKCLKGISYDVTSMAVKDMDLVLKKYCDSKKLSKLYISWANCGNSAITETVKCWQQYILDMERVNVEKDKIKNNDKVGLICCNYHRFDHCVEESFIRVGADRCSTASVEGLHSILTEISGRMVENFCGDYQIDNDLCDSLLTEYKHLNNIKFAKTINKSPINAFIQIIDNTPEFLKYLKTSDNKTY